MSVEIRSVPVSDLCLDDNFMEVLAEYSDDLAMEGLPHPKADIETYKALEKTGIMTLFTAWEEGEVVGLINILFAKNPHYGIGIATSESFYVSKDHRKTGAGILLLREAEKHAMGAGSPALFVTSHVGSALQVVLKKLGYEDEAVISVKRFA